MSENEFVNNPKKLIERIELLEQKNHSMESLEKIIKCYIVKTEELNDKIVGGDKLMDENDIAKLWDAVNTLTNSVNGIQKGDPDLNGDGTITKEEQNIYDFFTKSLQSTQKNSLWNNLIMAFFSLASLLSVVLSFLRLTGIF